MLDLRDKWGKVDKVERRRGKKGNEIPNIGGEEEG